jgi:hypothetical protein
MPPPPADVSWDVIGLDLGLHYGQNTEDFMAKFSDLNIGFGDDVFMVGRFLGHTGKTCRNEPVVRFGNVSLVPRDQLVYEGRNFWVQAFLVEMHPLPGFSGSPAFLHIPAGDYRGPGIEPSRGNKYILPDIDTGH